MARPKKLPSKKDIDTMVAMVLEGATIKSIASHFKMSVGTAFKWMHSSPEIEQMIAKAREDSAFILADKAMELALNDEKDFYEHQVQGTIPNPTAVQRAKLAVQQLNKTAAQRNNLFNEKQVVQLETEGGYRGITIVGPNGEMSGGKFDGLYQHIDDEGNVSYDSIPNSEEDE